MISLHSAEEVFHVFTESHIEHAVSLIENGQLDGGWFQGLAAQVVEQAAWCSHDNMGTTFELGDLAVDRSAAINRHGA